MSHTGQSFITIPRNISLSFPCFRLAGQKRKGNSESESHNTKIARGLPGGQGLLSPTLFPIYGQQGAAAAGGAAGAGGQEQGLSSPEQGGGGGNQEDEWKNIQVTFVPNDSLVQSTSHSFSVHIVACPRC